MRLSLVSLHFRLPSRKPRFANFPQPTHLKELRLLRNKIEAIVIIASLDRLPKLKFLLQQTDNFVTHRLKIESILRNERRTMKRRAAPSVCIMNESFVQCFIALWSICLLDFPKGFALILRSNEATKRCLASALLCNIASTFWRKRDHQARSRLSQENGISIRRKQLSNCQSTGEENQLLSRLSGQGRWEIGRRKDAFGFKVQSHGQEDRTSQPSIPANAKKNQ